MYSTYVLLQADSACKNVHDLVHDVVPQKDMFLQGIYLFGSFVIFKTVCPSSVFGRSGRRPSSSGHVPRGTRTCICAHVNFYDHARDRISRSRARSYERSFQSVQDSNPWPCTRSFLWVQGLIPWPCSTIFMWVQSSIPGPDHLFQARSIRGLCQVVQKPGHNIYHAHS